MPEQYQPMLPLDDVLAAFRIAGLEVQKTYELMNPYWPHSYHELVLANPWYLVKTEFGLICVGARKRVFVIDWEDTAYRGEDIVAADVNITKTESLIHAWSLMDFTQYLATLHNKLVELKRSEQAAQQDE